MNTLTLVRTAAELAPQTQSPKPSVVPVQPQASWPLPATQFPSAHLTWDEWVARLSVQLVRERQGEDSVREAVSCNDDEPVNRLYRSARPV